MVVPYWERTVASQTPGGCDNLGAGDGASIGLAVVAGSQCAVTQIDACRDQEGLEGCGAGEETGGSMGMAPVVSTAGALLSGSTCAMSKSQVT
jgi:hypothetical protein